MVQDLIHILHNEDCTCVIRNQEIRRFHNRGIVDLYNVYDREPQFLDGAAVADHAIGKAAAAILIAGKAKHVYADLISLSALILLREAGIPTDYGQVVSYIQNHHLTDWCPMESECYSAKNVEDMMPLIKNFVEAHR